MIKFKLRFLFVTYDKTGEGRLKMKLTKSMKKVAAYICTIALLVGGMTGYQAKADVEDVELTSTEQSESTEAAGYTELSYEAFLLGDIGQNQYKATCGKGLIDKIVNIQQYGAATEPGIYVAFRDANIGEITINGAKMDAFIDGAGIIMYLSNFKYMYSDVVVKNSSGEEKAVLYVYNAKGIDNTDKAIIKPGTEGETSADIALEEIPQFGRYLSYGSYRIMRTSDKTAHAGLDPINSDHIRVQNTSGPGGTQSKLTVTRTFMGLTAGTKYVLSVDISPSIADGTYTIMTDSTPRPLQLGTTTVSMVSKAYGEGKADFSLSLDNIGEDVILDISNPQFREYVEGETIDPPTTESKPVETTPEETEPAVTTNVKPVEITTNKKPVETTTDIRQGEITKPVIEATQSQTTEKTTKVKVPTKAKIKKITPKKKSSKKIKLTLKKIKRANGYQVAIYKTKKNASDDTKAVIKKVVKKTKLTIKSKKIKNKKKLYIKARAYILNANGKKNYGKWSKIKKVKIKK